MWNNLLHSIHTVIADARDIFPYTDQQTSITPHDQQQLLPPPQHFTDILPPPLQRFTDNMTQQQIQELQMGSEYEPFADYTQDHVVLLQQQQQLVAAPPVIASVRDIEAIGNRIEATID